MLCELAIVCGYMARGTAPAGCPAARGERKCLMYVEGVTRIEHEPAPEIREQVDAAGAEVKSEGEEAGTEGAGHDQAADGARGPEAIDPESCPSWGACKDLDGPRVPLDCPAARSEVKCDIFDFEKAAAHMLALDLSRVRGLREYLVDSARNNLRSTVEDEALFILKQFMQAHRASHNEFQPPPYSWREVIVPLDER
jgi:hypothetical protein